MAMSADSNLAVTESHTTRLPGSGDQWEPVGNQEPGSIEKDERQALAEELDALAAREPVRTLAPCPSCGAPIDRQCPGGVPHVARIRAAAAELQWAGLQGWRSSTRPPNPWQGRTFARESPSGATGHAVAVQTEQRRTGVDG